MGQCSGSQERTLLIGSDLSLPRGGGSHSEGETAADVDQRPCMGPGGDGRVGPWADGLLWALPCGHWAGISRMGLKPSKRPFRVRRTVHCGPTTQPHQHAVLSPFPSLDGHPFTLFWVSNPTLPAAEAPMSEPFSLSRMTEAQLAGCLLGVGPVAAFELSLQKK